MARSRKSNDQQLITVLLQLVQKIPPKYSIPLAIVLLVGFLIWNMSGCPLPNRPPNVPQTGEPGSYLFCWWNVENLFDDQDDPKNHDDDEDWYGNDPLAFREKIDQLANVLIEMKDGIGPDILAMCEVENERCLQALMDCLNEKLNSKGRADQYYRHILFKIDNLGRRFAPAIITRLPVEADRTRKLGERGLTRILEGRIVVNGYPLTIIASHWTSRLTDKDEDGSKRAKYADYCFGRFRAIFTENPDADVIVCGDFNDEFQDRSVQEHLHAKSKKEEVEQSRTIPTLYDLCARFDGKTDPKGTIYGKGRWSVFDHICISRGLLDENGWTCDTEKTEIHATKAMKDSKGRPFESGGKNNKGKRGYSDHFPVLTQLRVAGRTNP